MKKGNIIASILCIIFGAYIIITAMSYPPAKNGVPGPGMFPIIIASMLILSSVSLIITSFKIKKESDKELNMLSNDSKRVYIVMAMLVGYFIVLKFIGFILCTIVLLFALIKWFSKKNIIICLVISIVITLVVYLVFNRVLNVPLDFGLISF